MYNPRLTDLNAVLRDAVAQLETPAPDIEEHIQRYLDAVAEATRADILKRRKMCEAKIIELELKARNVDFGVETDSLAELREALAAACRSAVSPKVIRRDDPILEGIDL